MPYEFTQTATTTQQVTQSVLQSLGRLQQKRQLDDTAHDNFAAIRSVLESMALATDQFDLACRRLQNAQRWALSWLKWRFRFLTRTRHRREW